VAHQHDVPASSLPDDALIDEMLNATLAVLAPGARPPRLPRELIPDPRRETEAQWQARSRHAWRWMRKSLIAAGYQLRVGKIALYHFEWLARYQVGGESYRQIAISLRAPELVSTAAVATAIKRTAALVGLELRPRNKAGRPPKHVVGARRS
jgi:hypothetical protein